MSFKRFVVLTALLLLGLPAVAHAEDTTTRVNIDNETLIKGYTVTHHHDDVKVAVMPDQIDQTVRVVIKNLNVDELPELPAGKRLVSDAFSYDIIGNDYNPIIVKRPSNVAIRYTASVNATAAVYNWDGTKHTWYRMPSDVDHGNQYVRGSTVMPYSIIVALEDETVRASWFSWTEAYAAASNTYPIGTRLRVTNVENNASVDVTVKSTGPFDPRYGIDLTKDAFASIGDPSTGTLDVIVKELAGTDGAGIDEPAIQSRMGIVMNARTGEILWGDDIHDRQPIASMTKLMTALVLQDLDMDMGQTITIESSDLVAGSNVLLYAGDQVKALDLYRAMLIRSSNNTAIALARATGLTRSAFVAKMNAKARALGMTETTFADPSGLDTGNVSTARDVALLAKNTFVNLDMLIATTSPSGSFTIINTSRRIDYRNTNTLIRDGSSLWFLGSKTGYLDEAGYCLVTKVRDANNHEIITVILNAPTSQTRFDETALLATWGLSHVR